TGKFERQLKELEKIEDRFGLTRKDIERVTWVLIDFKHQDFWAIVHTTKAYDKDKIFSAIKKQEGEVTEKSFDGKTYYQAGRGKGTFWFPSNRIIVVASSREAMEKCLTLPAKPQSGPLDDA